MNTFRLFGLVAIILALSAIPVSAAAIPQSPINIEQPAVTTRIDRTDKKHAVSKEHFNYPDKIKLKLEPKHTLTMEESARREGEVHDKVTIAPPIPENRPTLKLDVGGDERPFNFYQLHLHTLAEHIIGTQHVANGNLSPRDSELHMVHIRPKPNQTCVGTDDIKAGKCQLVVVGRWIEVAVPPVEPGPPDESFGHNADLAPLFNRYALGPGDVPDFDMQKLLPSNYEHYRYTGSLTSGQKPGDQTDIIKWKNDGTIDNAQTQDDWVSTIPVEWVMYREPIVISQAQMNQYDTFLGLKDNHFAAQYTTHQFAAWKRTDGHGLKSILPIPEPSTSCLLVVAAAVVGLCLKWRRNGPYFFPKQ